MQQELELAKKQFESDLFRNFSLEKLNQRLREWYKLEWHEFRKEILKTGESLTYRRQSALEEYFKDQKEKVLSLSRELDKTT